MFVASINKYVDLVWNPSIKASRIIMFMFFEIFWLWNIFPVQTVIVAVTIAAAGSKDIPDYNPGAISPGVGSAPGYPYHAMDGARLRRAAYKEHRIPGKLREVLIPLHGCNCEKPQDHTLPYLCLELCTGSGDFDFYGMLCELYKNCPWHFWPLAY